MKLTVQNAEIKTATVEVKTLTISGKQVTQAVFRQLPEETLLARNWTFRGIPWGRVNYHPDEACKHTGPHGNPDYRGRMTEWCYAEHVHIVWQLGVELRRSLLWNKCDCTYPEGRIALSAKRASVHAMLLDLPQLFIAV